MNRAGLLNFWYYDDEIFDFSDGKLLLRGSNGSGKSVTMQSILPVLLDGKKSPDRLDPFGSKSRKMEDYLLGEKDIVDRDERTGYLFIEYKREDTNQYITTGIGLQARRHKTMNFWGFVITDNRRIGKDLSLYEMEYHAGEKQKIPLSRVQLENRIDKGGQVVRTQGDYMRLVNKYIFGFETIEAYEDLIKLLIQLRSPKLSKDFKPTVIYEILEAALPPLTDEDLRHLSDTIEHMDQTKQQIEQLEREHTAVSKLIKRYDSYNEIKLAEKARGYVETNKRFKKEEKTVQEKMERNQLLEQEIASLKVQSKALDQTIAVLEQKQSRLQSHKVWNLEKERTDEQQALRINQTDLAKKDNQRTAKQRQELRMKETKESLETDILSVEANMENQLADLQGDADAAAFSQHELNVQDLYRHMETAHDFMVWEQEAESHFQLLNEISEQLRTYEQLKKELADLDQSVAAVKQAVDKLKREEADWLAIFEKDKQDKLNEIHAWTEAHVFFRIDAALLKQTARDIDQLYEDVVYEKIRAPFVNMNHQFQLEVNEKIAMKNSEWKALQEKIAEKADSLSEWKNKQDPEPEQRKEATKEARKQLKKSGMPFISFYEAVEFQEYVPEETQKRIEAALLDTGILDALITAEEIPVQHDRILKANPNMMAYTLADLLKPDTAADGDVSAIKVDEILRSILVDAESEEDVAIHEDGTYKIGLINGHAVPVDKVRFIGRNARRRYREEQITLLSREIETLENEQHGVKEQVTLLNKEIQNAAEALVNFPDDEDLQVSYTNIKEKRFQIEQHQNQIQQLGIQMNDTYQKYRTEKAELDTKTRDLNIEFSFVAYQEAVYVMRRYEKDLKGLITIYTTYQHQRDSLQQTNNRLAELIEEVDELNGEINLLNDKQHRIGQNIAEIEKQLADQGAEAIRQQIQSVQHELAETNKALKENQNTLPYQEAAKQTLETEIEKLQQQIRFWEHLTKAWFEAFAKEVSHGFVSKEEDTKTTEQLAVWVDKNYRQMLKEKDNTKVESQLTSMYHEQETNLIEYRMSDTIVLADTFSWMEDEWTEEQRILIDNWKQKANRRLIELDFQGKRVSPYYIEENIEQDRLRQQTMLDDQDRQLYEEILYDSVGKKLRSRIYRAQEWTKKMNQLMENSDSSSGLSFSIRWKPRTAETEAELDTKELVDLLRRDPRLLKEDDLNQVITHFRSRIENAKELVEIKGEGSTLLQVLKDVLDYRNWFSFVLSYQREGEPKRELTNHAFFQFSGGEKAMAMYIPLFTACYSRYLEADATAPYIISLDEAFAGVDEDNISVMFRIVEELGFDYMMNSQVLWGDYDTISSLSICELIRPKNADYVSVIRYHWDGNSRKLLIDEDAETKSADKL